MAKYNLEQVVYRFKPSNPVYTNPTIPDGIYKSSQSQTGSAMIPYGKKVAMTAITNAYDPCNFSCSSDFVITAAVSMPTGTYYFEFGGKYAVILKDDGFLPDDITYGVFEIVSGKIVDFNDTHKTTMFTLALTAQIFKYYYGDLQRFFDVMSLYDPWDILHHRSYYANKDVSSLIITQTGMFDFPIKTELGQDLLCEFSEGRKASHITTSYCSVTNPTPAKKKKKAISVKIPTKIPVIDFGRKLTALEKAQIPTLTAELDKEFFQMTYAMATNEKFNSAILYGPAGTGKTTACKIMCREMKLPLKAVVNCTSALDQYILGKFIPDSDTFVFKESPIVDAIRNGGAVVMEEINFGSPRHLSFLNSLLDDNGFILLDNGEEVRRNKNFRFFATMNPGYAGTQTLNASLFDRFRLKKALNKMESAKIHSILTEMDIPDAVAGNMIAVYDAIYENLVQQGDDEKIVSPRDLIFWAKFLRAGLPFKTAAHLTIEKVAQDDVDFIDFIHSMVEINEPEDDCYCTNISHPSCYILQDEEIEQLPVMPKTIKHSPEMLHVKEAMSRGECMSYIQYGPAGTGKSTACKAICASCGIPVKAVINCTSSLDQYVLGKFIPAKNGFEFKESPIVDAIRNGGAVIFEEINFGNPKHLSFLNSLLDDNGFVLLDNGEIVNRHPKFYFFATMNPGYSGTSSLNLSLFNRFEAGSYIALDNNELKSRLPKTDNTDLIFDIYTQITKKIGVDNPDCLITFRTLEAWVELAEVFGVAEAAENTILGVSTDPEITEEIRNIISENI